MAPHATEQPDEDNTRTLPFEQGELAVLASSRAVIGSTTTPATIVISTRTGKIQAVYHSVLPASSFPTGTSYVDHSPHILIPGLVDAHVHLNEPGRTEWEGFWTGTRAAAFGGVTTVVDMPLNAIPPTTTVAGFEEKIAAAQGKCWVDVGFYGGIVPGNTKELKPLIKKGVRGFKGFLIDSGVCAHDDILRVVWVANKTNRSRSFLRCRQKTLPTCLKSWRMSLLPSCSMPR